MSAYKWDKLQQLALMHDVAAYVYQGLQQSKDQFFLHLTDKQWTQWETATNELRKKRFKNDEEPDEFLRADHLTNPVLNRILQNILDDEQSDTHTRQLLLTIIRCSRHILNEGVPSDNSSKSAPTFATTGVAPTSLHSHNGSRNCVYSMWPSWRPRSSCCCSDLKKRRFLLPVTR